MSVATLPAVSVEEVEAELARRNLSDFIRQAWPLVEPGTPLSWNWHHEALCEVLESVTRGDLDRLVVNIPPGHSKSLMVSVLWPAWEWARRPDLRYFTASYSNDLTIRDNRRLRSIVTSEWYRRHFGLQLAGDQSAKIRFDTTAKGWRIASSVGGGGTGEHPDRIIIDDALKALDARSETARRSVVGWFDGTISTRVNRDPAIVVIMQRLHEEDLSGHLLSRGGWHHVCFPMRFDPEHADPLDERVDAGELLWPELFPERKVRNLERELGPYGTAGQLQQRPAPEGGGLFKREWFETVPEVPAAARRCRGWDTASTEGAGDWTVGVKIAGPVDGTFYVEDVVREQLGPSGVEKLMFTTVQVDGRSCAQREEEEPGSSGKTVIANRTRLLAGFNYRGDKVTGDKVTRALPFRAQCEAGNVKLKRAEWNKDFLGELSVFPMGKHDDQVDAASCAFNELTTGPRPARTAKVRLG